MGVAPVLLANEFGSAYVSIDRNANAVRLRIEDPRTGSAVLFDPFELQCLAYLTTNDVAEFMRPHFQEKRQIEADEQWPPDTVEEISGPQSR